MDLQSRNLVFVMWSGMFRNYPGRSLPNIPNQIVHKPQLPQYDSDFGVISHAVIALGVFGKALSEMYVCECVCALSWALEENCLSLHSNLAAVTVPAAGRVSDNQHRDLVRNLLPIECLQTRFPCVPGCSRSIWTPTASLSLNIICWSLNPKAFEEGKASSRSCVEVLCGAALSTRMLLHSLHLFATCSGKSHSNPRNLVLTYYLMPTNQHYIDYTDPKVTT